jgi:hypothetical protein
MKSLNISFEDLVIATGPTDTEVIEAEQVLETIPAEVDVQIQAAATDVIKTTEAGETLLGVVSTLDTFADQTDRVLEVGIVGPEHIQQHVEGVNESLAAIGDSLKTVSTESVGSFRVSLESANTATRAKIQEIIAFARKTFQLLWTKLKELWKLFTDSNKRLQAKATKVAQEARRIHTAHYRKTTPSDKDSKLSLNMTYLQHNGTSSTDVLAGLKKSAETLTDFFKQIEYQAEEHLNEISHLARFVKSNSTLPTPKNLPWESESLSGNVKLSLEQSTLYPTFRLTKPEALHAEIDTPIPDDLFEIATIARDIAIALAKCNGLQDTLTKHASAQRTIAEEIGKFAVENPTSVAMSDVRKLNDMASKQFAGDLVRIERYFTTVVEHALSYVVKGIRAY